MSRKKVDTPLTVLVKPELDAILRNRAEKNHRTISKEIIFLIETALGLESEAVRNTLHLLYAANGGVIEDEGATPPHG